MKTELPDLSNLPAESWVLPSPDAEVRGTRIGNDRWRVTTRSLRGRLVPRGSCETTFPRELIEQLVRTTGPEWICDAIARHEDPGYVRKVIQDQLTAYFAADDFRGKRLLDFGCGNGASTMIIARLLPDTEVIGVELDATNIAEANAILSHRGLKNVQFLQSPSPNSLPPGIGTFDFVMLSAVFEHLLPDERRMLMPLLWSHLRVGGSIFINQTPYRWHPYEHHSTRLWGINYLPDRAAWRLASRWTGGTRSSSWQEMLRGGIRGGTERSIRAALTGGRLESSEVLQPTQHGLRDRADYWLHCTSPRRRPLKRLVAHAFRISDAVLGTIPALNVDVVIRKVR
jgi:2-polyprenyl-3-methyl-5-hydroxy-6-metoxy-1,4-benzoquinol methylase